MSCCGDNRKNIFVVPSGFPSQFQAGNNIVSNANPGSTRAFFQYTGMTRMLVIGAVTGVHYRFEVPGAIVSVDIRDRASLATVPNLKEVIVKL